jgi:hypothetical protein
MGICPTNSGFKYHRMNLLRQLLKTYDIDGIWLDYFHWHAQFESPDPILPETCFCDNCLNSFKSETGIKLPDLETDKIASWILSNHESSWRNWRCKVLYDWAFDIKQIMHEEKPGILLGIYYCPWTNDDFDGARRDILGLDLKMLRSIVDVFSPMVYHALMDRSAEWVKENVHWHCNEINSNSTADRKIWPIIQAYDNPYEISAEELGNVIINSVSGCADGVMIFTGKAIADDKNKTELMRNIYLNWKNKYDN